MRRWLILAVAAGLLFTACGGGGEAEGIASLQDQQASGDGSTTTAPTAVDAEQAMLDFAQCMRDHGIDMPDPQMGPGGGAFGFTIQGEVGDDAQMEADMQELQEADEACRHFLEGIVQEFEQPDMAEMQDQMLAFSQCMRDHGIEYPDPVFSEDGGVTLIGPDEGGQAFDPADPEFQAAQEACQEIFGGEGAFIVSGTGSSGGIVVGPGGAGGEVIPVIPLPSPEEGDGDSSGG